MNRARGAQGPYLPPAERAPKQLLTITGAPALEPDDAAALRLLLGRLRSVEQATGASVLACIDWGELHRATSYIPGLWSGAGSLLQG